MGPVYQKKKGYSVLIELLLLDMRTGIMMAPMVIFWQTFLFFMARIWPGDAGIVEL